MTSEYKVYVDVKAKFKKNGDILPLEITWEDGRTFEIQKILDIRPAASLKAGGTGIRYKVKIGANETFIFLEENKWFVERKQHWRG